MSEVLIRDRKNISKKTFKKIKKKTTIVNHKISLDDIKWIIILSNIAGISALSAWMISLFNCNVRSGISIVTLLSICENGEEIISDIINTTKNNFIEEDGDFEKSKKIAQEYLLFIQKNIYGSSDRSLLSNALSYEFFKRRLDYFIRNNIGDENVDEIKKNIIEYYKNEILMKSSSFIYENDMMFFVMKTISNKIEKTISSNGYKVNYPPIFGTIPTGRVNGMALKVPNSKNPIIIIDDGLFIFAHSIGKIIAKSIGYKIDNENIVFSATKKNISSTLIKNKKIKKYFLDSVFSYLTGDITKSEWFEVDAPTSDLGSIYCNSIESFIIAHEYGHILNGDLDGNPETHYAKGIDSNVIKSNWKKEYDADATAMYLLLNTYQEPAFIISGVCIFFEMIYILEKIKSIIETGKVEKNIVRSHPPPNLRLEKLEKLFFYLNPEEDHIYKKSGYNMPLNSMKYVLSELFQLCEKSFLKAYKEKIKIKGRK